MRARSVSKVRYVYTTRQAKGGDSADLVRQAAREAQTSISFSSGLREPGKGSPGPARELAAARTGSQTAAGNVPQPGDERRADSEGARSANEDVQSARAELLTAKNELQSLHGEMASLNARLENSLHQQHLTLDGLYSSNICDVPTLFLDTKLVLRFFTPAAKPLLNVAASDVGRPLTDLVSFSTDGCLASDARLVLDGSPPVAREVEARAGGWFVRRVVPYLAGDKGVGGLVITFTDITRRKGAAGALGAANQEAAPASAARGGRKAALEGRHGQTGAGARERCRDLEPGFAVQQQLGGPPGLRASSHPARGGRLAPALGSPPPDEPAQATDGRLPGTASRTVGTLRRNGKPDCLRLGKSAGTGELPAIFQQPLPRNQATPQPTRQDAPVVFVIEDDCGIQAALREVLEAEGMQVRDFGTGEAFLNAYQPGCWGCLLVDAGLPGMSGLDVLLRMRDAGSRLPAIMITGQSDVGTAVRAMKAGACDYIEKPIGHGNLLASVARAIERSWHANEHLASREDAAARIAGLTGRQREVMDLVLAGQPSKIIAADLGLSQRTVENHRAVIMRKTGARSLPALARLADVVRRNDAGTPPPGTSDARPWSGNFAEAGTRRAVMTGLAAPC